MVQSINIKLDLWLRDLPKKKVKTFFDTYSPVTRLTTIRVLVALAASHGLIIHQMDVKTTFLNGELDEKIYMQQYDGFVAHADCENLYMTLNKHPNSGTKSLIEL
jgi:hypothetical protein